MRSLTLLLFQRQKNHQTHLSIDLHINKNAVVKAFLLICKYTRVVFLLNKTNLRILQEKSSHIA